MVGEHGAACWRARRCAAEGRRLQCLWDQMGTQQAAETSSPVPEEEMDPGSEVTRWELAVPKRNFSPVRLSCDTSGVVGPWGEEKAVAQLVWRLLGVC